MKMRIQTRIRKVAQAQGITNAYQLQKITGLSSSMAARLYRDDVKGLTLKVIEILCDALDCDPCELLVRVEEVERREVTIDRREAGFINGIAVPPLLYLATILCESGIETVALCL